ncbi:MAG: bacterial Ig-like domain-containing protein, partial [Bacteroidaceae bacterium]|nr:bacterial Ig-like domain-containing protein [Bacteroidaceae bacterium]
MNMFTKKLNWLIMSMMLMVSGSAWAGEETIDFSKQGYKNGDAVEAVEATNFTVTFDQGTNANNAPTYYTTGTAIRAYGGNTFTVSSSYTITKITLTFGSSDGSNKIYTDVGSFTSPNWTGSANSVTFTIDGKTGNRRILSITVTCDGGGTVVTKTLSSITLSGEYPTEFQQGDEFSHEGMTVTATYNDGTSADVTSSATFSGYDMSDVSEQTVTVTYEEGEVTKTATYQIIVNEAPVVPAEGEKTGTIIFGTNDTKINKASVTGEDSQGNTWTITTTGTSSFTANADYYQVGASKSPATSITFTTTLPSSRTIKSMSAKFGGFGGTAGTITLKVGDTTVGTGSLNATADVTVKSTSEAAGTVLTVTVTDIEKGVKCYNISYTYEDDGTVVTKTLSSIVLSGTYPTEFEQGDEFSHEGMTVTATYDDESTADVTSKAIFSGYDMSTAGEQTVTVTYTEGEVS